MVSIYFSEFEVLEEYPIESRNEFIAELVEAHIREDEEGNQVIMNFDGMYIPVDYLEHCETHGLASLKIVGEDKIDVLSLSSPPELRWFREDYVDSYPSAFLIARTEKGEYHAFMNGNQGVGLYEISTGGCEADGVYLAATFTDLYINGMGVDKLKV